MQKNVHKNRTNLRSKFCNEALNPKLKLSSPFIFMFMLICLAFGFSFYFFWSFANDSSNIFYLLLPNISQSANGTIMYLANSLQPMGLSKFPTLILNKYKASIRKKPKSNFNL